MIREKKMIKAGFSRVDVTPPLGSFLAGYYEVRRAKGILDPIEINTIALTDGESTVVILACDFEAIHTNYATAIRNAHPDKIVFTACITNGYQGYFPTKVAFEQGGYEIVTSVFKDGVEEECTSAINAFNKE